MSVSIEYANERFIRHKFLSISPYSTTIFERTFDLLKGKYHIPTKKYEVVDENTGEITIQESEIKPPTDKFHNGSLSDKGRRNLQRSVYTLMSFVDKNMLIDGTGKHNISFVTLTLPSYQIKSINETGIEYWATDKQIKSQCFNSFITELRTLHGVTNYVWVTEKQLNGSIHFHMLLDRKIDYLTIQRRWNALINKFGFVDRYASKMSKLTKQQYIELRLSELKKEPNDNQLKKIEKAYEIGVKSNWQHPNSTDIQNLKKIKNVAAYISKYMSKSHGHTEKDVVAQISKIVGKSGISPLVLSQMYKIEGRIWQCSQAISKARRCIIVCESEYESELSYMSKVVTGTKVFIEDTFLTVIHKFQNLKNYCFEIFTSYQNHITSHLHGQISHLFNDNYSPCGMSLSSVSNIQNNVNAGHLLSENYQTKIQF